MKKILALIIAAMMLAAMLTTATAATLVGGKATTNETTLDIPMSIDVHYNNLEKVFSPTITYNYSVSNATNNEIASATSNTVVTVDGTETKTAVVKIGPISGVTLSDAEADFTSALHELSNNTYTVKDNITVSVDLERFRSANFGPGIYRYIITDITTKETLLGAGVTRADNYNTKYYLDVYIVRNGSDELEVSNYVLTNQNVVTLNSDEHKISEFPHDNYYPVDVSVKKVVEGTMGNKTHEFPFTITVDNSSLHYFGARGTVTLTNEHATTTILTVLKHDDVYMIKGLNPNATVSYTEQNDTPDTYILNVTNKATTKTYVNDNQQTPAQLHDVSIGNSASKTTATLSVTNNSTVNADSTFTGTVPTLNDDSEITFTNTLNEVSPTGVVLRFGPYLIMAGIAVFLLVIAARRRKDTQDKSNSI